MGDGGVYAALDEGYVLFNIGKQPFYILALGMLVGRAGVVQDGLILCKGCDICLVYIDHGADEGHFRPVHIGYGCKGGEPALKKHGEEKRFDKVVGMVAEGKLVAAHFNGYIVECAAAHLCTKAAGVGFLADVKDDFGNVGFFHAVLNVKLAAEVCHGLLLGRVGAFKPHIDVNGAEVKFFRIKAAQPGKNI